MMKTGSDGAWRRTQQSELYGLLLGEEWVCCAQARVAYVRQGGWDGCQGYRVLRRGEE